MSFCPQCRRPLDPGARFCPNCGYTAPPPGPGPQPFAGAPGPYGGAPQGYGPPPGHGAPGAPGGYGPPGAPGGYAPPGPPPGPPGGGYGAPPGGGYGAPPGAGYGAPPGPPAAVPPPDDSGMKMLGGCGIAGCLGIVIAAVLGVVVIAFLVIAAGSSSSASSSPGGGAGSSEVPSNGSVRDLVRPRVGAYTLLATTPLEKVPPGVIDSVGAVYTGPDGTRVVHLLLVYPTESMARDAIEGVFNSSIAELKSGQKVKRGTVSDSSGNVRGTIVGVTGRNPESFYWNNRKLILVVSAPYPHAESFEKSAPY